MSTPPLIVDSNERGPLYEAVERMARKEGILVKSQFLQGMGCLLYTSPSPRDISGSRMPSSA